MAPVADAIDLDNGKTKICYQPSLRKETSVSHGPISIPDSLSPMMPRADTDACQGYIFSVILILLTIVALIAAVALRGFLGQFTIVRVHITWPFKYDWPKVKR